MFYPPKGLCEAEPEWGPFENSFHLLCLEKGVGTFKFSGGERPFWNLENALSPEGTPKGEPKVVQLFLLMFYFSILLCLEKGVWHFQFTGGNSPFWNLENVLLSDGLGWIEYQKSPSLFFILCRYIEHIYIYLCIYSKTVTNILKGFKIWFFTPSAWRTAWRTTWRTAWRNAWRTCISKVSFYFLHTLWVYRSGIYLLIHVIKKFRQHSYGF